jgi:hypothetical protein
MQFNLFAEQPEKKEVVVEKVIKKVVEKVDRGFLYSEQYRHRCEVRWLLSVRTAQGQAGKALLRDYLNKPAVQSRRENLVKDIQEQWREGNRGEKGQWSVILS